MGILKVIGSCALVLILMGIILGFMAIEVDNL